MLIYFFFVEFSVSHKKCQSWQSGTQTLRRGHCQLSRTDRIICKALAQLSSVQHGLALF